MKFIKNIFKNIIKNNIMNNLNIKAYHESISQEFDILKNRVRNLIIHPEEDGRYKEAILKNILRKFLPSYFLIGTGFIVKSTGIRGEHLASKQIDLIIYDSSLPVLFAEGDFVILTPESVKAIVEVKTNLQNVGIASVIKDMNNLGSFIYEGLKDFKGGDIIFNGIFSFEGFENINTALIEENIIKGYKEIEIDESIKIPEFKAFLVNHICLNNKYFIKSWPSRNKTDISIYELNNLSFSFFISNLIVTLSKPKYELNTGVWFPENKEIHKIHDFSIDNNCVRN